MLRTFFQQHFGRLPALQASAPGRLEFIGNHTDYNGGNVLGVAVDRKIRVALAPRTDDRIVLRSTQFPDDRVDVTISIEAPLSGKDAWANYALGMLVVMREAGMAVPHGFDMAVDSDLPAGAGMSSSAAFELASGYALSALYQFPVERAAMARLGRKAENQFVGVPCGILDQGVSAFGEKDHLVFINCREEAFQRHPLPACVHFHVFNTGKKHALIDSLYATRHQECQRALADLRRRYPEAGCLCDVTHEQLLAAKAELDPVLFRRAEHVICENQRVMQTVQALKMGDMKEVGRLLFASHASSRDLFENSCEELDYLVDALQGKPGVYGARLTGGGFGGAVMAVTDGNFSGNVITDVVDGYARRFGHSPATFHAQTGPGAGVDSPA